MLSVALAALAGLAALIGVYTLFRRESVSAYAVGGANAGPSYVQARVRGWYDRWDAQWRIAGYAMGSSALPGNIPVFMFVAIAAILFLPFGFVPAVALAGGAVFALWTFLGRRGRKRNQEIEVIAIDFVGSLASKVSFLSPREAFIATVNDSSEVMVHEIFGPAVAELNSGGSLSRALMKVAADNPHEAIAEVCAELDSADKEGASSTTTVLNRLRDGLVERDVLRREALAGDVLVKAMTKIFVFAPLVALVFSLLVAAPAWNNPIGFALMAFVVGGALGAHVLFKRMLRWRMDY